MPDSFCAVQCTNMQGKCDEKIKFYIFPAMKTEQTTERQKKWITAMKRENWPNLRSKLTMLGFVVNILRQVLNQMILFIQIISRQYLLLSLWLVPRGREKVFIDMKDLKNMQETRTKIKNKKKTLLARMKQQFM